MSQADGFVSMQPDWARAIQWGSASFAAMVLLYPAATLVTGEDFTMTANIMLGVIAAFVNGAEAGYLFPSRRWVPGGVWAGVVSGAVVAGWVFSRLESSAPAVNFSFGFTLAFSILYGLILSCIPTRSHRFQPPKGHPENL